MTATPQKASSGNNLHSAQPPVLLEQRSNRTRYVLVIVQGDVLLTSTTNQLSVFFYTYQLLREKCGC